MSLEKKYNIASETLKRMVQDGIISGSVVRDSEVYDLFLQIKSFNTTRTNKDIFFQMSEDLKMSTHNIERIVYGELRKL